MFQPEPYCFLVKWSLMQHLDHQQALKLFTKTTLSEVKRVSVCRYSQQGEPFQHIKQKTEFTKT